MLVLLFKIRMAGKIKTDPGIAYGNMLHETLVLNISNA